MILNRHINCFRSHTNCGGILGENNPLGTRACERWLQAPLATAPLHSTHNHRDGQGPGRISVENCNRSQQNSHCRRLPTPLPLLPAARLPSTPPPPAPASPAPRLYGSDDAQNGVPRSRRGPFRGGRDSSAGDRGSFVGDRGYSVRAR